MTARQVSEADRAVLEECARRGVMDITARKLERWRRYLPDRVVEHRRGLRGSRTFNPPHYVDQVLTLDALVKGGMPLRHAPIHLFAQGFSVRINDLRDAYTDLYAHVRHGLTENSTHIDEEPADHADRLATLHAAGIRKSAAGRRWAKRARQLVARGGARQGDDPDALFTAALSAMFTWMIAGEQPSSEGVTEALSIAGLNDGQDPEAAGTRLAAMHLDAISTAIDQATQADWLTARQNIEVLAHYTELRPNVEKLGLPVDSRLKGITDVELGNPDVRAVLIPVALVFDETWLQQLLDQLEQFTVIARTLADMPDNLRLLFQDYAGHLEQEGSTEIPVELQAFFVARAQTHPDDAALFGVELPTPSPA